MKLNLRDIERTVLATYTMNKYLTFEDSKKVTSTQINTNLFTTSETHKSVAKAIKALQDEQKGIDDLMIEFKAQSLNQNEFIEILTTTPVSYESFINLIELLKQEHKALLAKQLAFF